MKTTPREAAMALATQAEQLPKLRDKLLDLVNQINLALNEGRNRKAQTQKTRSPFMGTGEGLTTRGTPRKRKGHKPGQPQPKPILLDTIPLNAREIPGVHTGFVWCQGLGMVSTMGKQPRLLRLPGSTKCYGLKNRKGDRLFLGLPKLEELLGFKPEMQSA